MIHKTISLIYYMNFAFVMLCTMCYLVADWKKLVVISATFVLLLLGGLLTNSTVSKSSSGR